MANLNAEAKQRIWFKKNGFNENGETWVYAAPDSYKIKDTLKALGYRYTKELRWHTDTQPADMTKHFKVLAIQVAEFMAWGDGVFFPNVQEKVDKMREAMFPKEVVESTSKFLQPADGKHFYNLEVTCTDRRIVNGAYGSSNLFSFATADGDVLTWFTSSDPDIEVNDHGFINAIFKEHKEFRGVNQTVINRVKMEKE